MTCSSPVRPVTRQLIRRSRSPGTNGRTPARSPPSPGRRDTCAPTSPSARGTVSAASKPSRSGQVAVVAVSVRTGGQLSSPKAAVARTQAGPTCCRPHRTVRTRNPTSTDPGGTRTAAAAVGATRSGGSSTWTAAMSTPSGAVTLATTVARPPSSIVSRGTRSRIDGPAVGRPASPNAAPSTSGAASTTRSARRSSTASSSRTGLSTTARASAAVGRHAGAGVSRRGFPARPRRRPAPAADRRRRRGSPDSATAQPAGTALRTAVGGAGTSPSTSLTTSCGDTRRSHISGLSVIRWVSTASATALTSSGVT